MRSEPRNYSRLAVAVFFYFCGLIFSSWATRIPQIKDSFQLNEAQLGGVLFMLPLGSFLALPFAGWAVHRIGSRFMSVASAILYSILLYAIAVSPSVMVLSVVLFWFGFLGDTLNIAMNTQALDVQRLFDRPLLSSFHAMWSVGALSGALFGGWTLKMEFSTSVHFLMVLIPVCLVSAVCYALLVKHDAEAESEKKLFTWPDKALWLIGIICFCCTLCEGAMADWSSLYYKQVLNDPVKVSTTGFTAYAFAMAIGRFSGDRLLMAMGYRKVVMLDSLLISGGLALALGIQVPIMVIIGFAMVGFGVSTIIPIAYMMAGKNKAMKSSVALATVSTIGFTGFLIGPPIIGFIAHEISLRYALLLVLFLGIIVFFLSRRIAAF